MKSIVTILTVVVFGLNPIQAETELKGSPTELSSYLATVPKLVTVTGEAEVKVPSDRASVNLRVRTENKSLREAMRLNQDIREQVISFLNKQGIEADRILSSRFASAQRFGIFGEKAKSHWVEHVLKVQVRDEKEFQAVAGTVDKWSEVHYAGTEFEHSDKEGFKSKALAQALDQASARKKLIEERLGVKLTPRSFSQEATASKAKVLEYVEKGSSLSKGGGEPSGYYGNAVDEGQSAFGELIYSARVNVEYALENK